MRPGTELQQPLFHGSDWNFDLLQRVYDAVAQVAYEDLHLDTYTNQLEIISAEQMLDAYSSIGMPLMYRHWSYGKRFLREEQLYRGGHIGLAYELVINSDPCICYLMEGNTAALQTLVIAHAAFGHNHFFKNNQLFRQWTDASAILTYLDFAKSFVRQCEERHGVAAVERVLDASHALMDQAFSATGDPDVSLPNGKKPVSARGSRMRSGRSMISGAHCRPLLSKAPLARQAPPTSSPKKKTSFISSKKTAPFWSRGKKKSYG